jgi:hypothetical protein
MEVVPLPSESKQQPRRKGTRWTVREIAELFESKGLQLLAPIEQTSVEFKHPFRCHCGQTCNVSVESLQLGRDSCKKCSIKKREIKKHDIFIQKTQQRREKRKQREEQEAKADKASETNKRSKIGPRWPEPRPKRSQFPDIEYNEWAALLQRWRNSCPDYKQVTARYRASRSVAQRERAATYMKTYCQAYCKTPKAKSTSKKYQERVKMMYKSLLEDISVDGHCAFKDHLTGDTCKVLAKDCDIDHTDPKTILKDGKPRKQACFGNIRTIPQFHLEIQRNTGENGQRFLQALCPHHHALKSFTALHKRRSPSIRQRWTFVARKKMEIGKCQFEDCDSAQLLCDKEQVTPAFHFDHIFHATQTAYLRT